MDFSLLVPLSATLLEDTEIQKVAEQAVKENQSNPYVINQFPALEKILNFANRDTNIGKQINDFWLQPPVGEQVKQNPANLDTTSESPKSISTSLSNLDYAIGSLCKLKSTFHQLRGKARQQGDKVNITFKELADVENWPQPRGIDAYLEALRDSEEETFFLTHIPLEQVLVKS